MGVILATQVVQYDPPGPIVKAFLEDSSFFRGILGPVGSGKSSACVLEILRRSFAQAPSPDGVRRTRWAIIRNTYGELRTSTLKTWHQWCPASFGRVNMDSPFIHRVVQPGFDMEVVFLALDRADDQRKLLSLELTGAWTNETKELEKAVIDTLTSRVGRYPSKLEGGPTWFGILADTNPPDETHWWYKMAEVETPIGWRFFRQPSGLSKEAENIKNLPPNYYLNLTRGKEGDWVKVFVEAEYGLLVEGKPVFPQYRDSLHTSPEILEPKEGFGLVIGADFGLTPAAVIGQMLPDGQILILDELITDNTGIIRFAELLSNYISKNYPDFDVVGCWADPSGSTRSQIDERTALDIMNEHTKWKWRPAPGDNSIDQRLEAVRHSLNRLIDGKPALVVSSKCTMIRKGFVSGYSYKLQRNNLNAVSSDTPNKNEYSHPHDALQYLVLGLGGYDVVLNKQKKRSRSGRPNFYTDNRSSRSMFDSGRQRSRMPGQRS